MKPWTRCRYCNACALHGTFYCASFRAYLTGVKEFHETALKHSILFFQSGILQCLSFCAVNGGPKKKKNNSHKCVNSVAFYCNESELFSEWQSERPKTNVLFFSGIIKNNVNIHKPIPINAPAHLTYFPFFLFSLRGGFGRKCARLWLHFGEDGVVLFLVLYLALSCLMSCNFVRIPLIANCALSRAIP